jgi:inositol transport system substrate-binding protein
MEPMTRQIALFLEHSSNAYMQDIAFEAQREATRHGLGIEVFYADSRFLQVQQVYSVLRDDRRHPAAIAILPLCVDGFARAAQTALGHGMDWICLHRPLRELPALRAKSGRNVVGFVTPDHREIGRQQARLASLVAPRGARILYVQGNEENVSALERLTGFREVTDGEIESVIDGNWTEDDARAATERWLAIRARSLPALDVIVCQSDTMATGVISACRSQGLRLGRPDFAQVPVIGCDGAPAEGRAFVDQGHLAGTVVLEGVGREAVRLVAARLQGRAARPDVILLPDVYAPSPSHPASEPALAMIS